MIPTIRHLQYARGTIGLGMVTEASEELEAIDWDDRMKLRFWRCALTYTTPPRNGN